MTAHRLILAGIMAIALLAGVEFSVFQRLDASEMVLPDSEGNMRMEAVYPIHRTACPTCGRAFESWGGSMPYQRPLKSGNTLYFPDAINLNVSEEVSR